MPTADLQTIHIMLEMSFPTQATVFFWRERNGRTLHNIDISLVEYTFLQLRSETKVVLETGIFIHFSSVLISNPIRFFVIFSFTGDIQCINITQIAFFQYVHYEREHQGNWVA
jgi:hypothetical protein